MNSLQLICETQVKNGLEVTQNISFLTLKTMYSGREDRPLNAEEPKLEGKKSRQPLTLATLPGFLPSRWLIHMGYLSIQLSSQRWVMVELDT